MKPIFQKKFLFGDIWLRNLQKITQIEVFGHFLDFASLVFLDFAHNDRWAWCLVAFVQFAGPVNVLLFNTFFPVERCGFTSHCLYRDSLTLIYHISPNRCRALAAPLNTWIEASLPLNALLYSNKHHTS